MAKEKPAGAKELSNSLYLFESQRNSADCVISAHGGYVFENRMFTVPNNVNVHFYAPHDAALIDPNISSYLGMQAAAVPTETISGGNDCRNYLLSKYQGAHGGDDGKQVIETYDQIRQGVARADFLIDRNLQMALKGQDPANPKPGLAELAMKQLQRIRGGNVLTVRNRWNIFLGVPLGEAIDTACRENPSLTEFHCLFCRSYMLGSDALPAQAVTFTAN